MDLFPANSDTDTSREKPGTICAFFVFGFLIYATYSLIISGAQDILAGTFVPTSAVLVANVGPYFIITVVAPYFIQKIAYFPRILAIFFLMVTGLTMVVSAKRVGVRLLGISLSSFGFGLGELSFIAMTSFYHGTAVSAFSAGTGTGISMAPLYYTGISLKNNFLSSSPCAMQPFPKATSKHTVETHSKAAWQSIYFNRLNQYLKILNMILCLRCQFNYEEVRTLIWWLSDQNENFMC